MGAQELLVGGAGRGPEGGAGPVNPLPRPWPRPVEPTAAWLGKGQVPRFLRAPDPCGLSPLGWQMS